MAKINPQPIQQKSITGGQGITPPSQPVTKKVKAETPQVVSKPVQETQSPQGQPAALPGLTVTTDSAGGTRMSTDTGLTQTIQKDGSRSITFGDSGAEFKIVGDDVQVKGGGVRNAGLTTDQDGVQLLSFQDKSGNRVQMDPSSMAFEVMNNSDPNKATVSQVFYPDGQQDVVAFRNFSKDGTNQKAMVGRASFDADGALLDSEGLSNVKAGKGKFSYEVDGKSISRSIPRALPGEPPLPEKVDNTVSPETSPTSLIADPNTGLLNQSGPLLLEDKRGEAPLLIEDKRGKAPLQLEGPKDQPKQLEGPERPLMIEGPKESPKQIEGPKESQAKKEVATQTEGTEKAAPSESPDKAAQAEMKRRMDELKNIGPDFWKPNRESDKQNGIQFVKADSGVAGRFDQGTKAFRLPNGDQVRTDGEIAVGLGENSNVKGAKFVKEDGKELISWNDKSRNSYQLDTNSGDFTVSRADGSLKQKYNADGSREFYARSVNTTPGGDVRPSEHYIKFDSNDNVVKRDGFDNLEVDKKSLSYTLPDGNPTVRNLVSPTDVKYDAKVDAPSDDPGWNSVSSAANSILGGGSPQASGATGTQETGRVGASPFQEPVMTPSGLRRKTLPDGNVETTLPSGLSFVDGEKPFARDADGTKLEVLKREVPSEGGYILYAKGKDGVGYTIAPDHMDMIAESKDGKVHQMVHANGNILTSIKDGKNQHLHQLDAQNQWQTSTPGVYTDVTTPNRLYVQGPENRSYELPHQLPSPQNQMQSGPYGQAPPNHPRMGAKPSFGQRIKSWFTGEPAGQAPQGPYGGQPGPQGPYGPGPRGPYGQGPHHPPMGGMPGAHYQHDYMSRELHEMNKMTRTMMTVNMIGSIAMPALFFLSF